MKQVLINALKNEVKEEYLSKLSVGELCELFAIRFGELPKVAVKGSDVTCATWKEIYLSEVSFCAMDNPCVFITEKDSVFSKAERKEMVDFANQYAILGNFSKKNIKLKPGKITDADLVRVYLQANHNLECSVGLC